MLFILLIFTLSPSSTETSQCYVGVQLGTAAISYKIVACATPSSYDRCMVEKIGNTFVKDIECDGGNRRHLKTLDNFHLNRLQFNHSRESITVGNYTCEYYGESGSYSCSCTGALCNEQLPTSWPAPPITTNSLACYVGLQIGNVDGYELTNCSTEWQWCVAEVHGRTILAGCLSYDDSYNYCQSGQGCTKDNDGIWYCCCNSSNGCNKDITASIPETPPTDADFQCSIGLGLSVAGIDGYKTMACPRVSGVSNACNTVTRGGLTDKDCETNNNACASAGIVEGCVTQTDQTNLCCCQTSKCNMPTTSSSLKTTPTTTNIIYTALVCIAAIVAILAR